MIKKMIFKAGCLLLTLLVGIIAFPLDEKENMAIYFNQPIINPFIIGGTVAGPAPHMVALTTGILSKSFFCGASIINERFILTAAHCILVVVTRNTLMRSLRGNMGSNRWSTSRIEHRFSHHIFHPDFINKIMKNDIGFLVTSSAITFTDNVQPVVLNFDYIDGNVATIANGWGMNVGGGPASQILMELRPVTVEGQQCIADVNRVTMELFGSPSMPIDPEIELCTFLGTNRGMCSGDSGSPLLLETNKQQIGIASWAIPCALGAPDMFVRISAYKSWIEQQLQETNILAI